MNWIEAEQGAGIGAKADPEPIKDLLEGELPTMLALRETIKGPEKLTQESEELFQQMGGDMSLLTEEQRDMLEWERPEFEPDALDEAKVRLGEWASLRGVRLSYEPPIPKLGRQALVERLRNSLATEVSHDVISLEGQSCW